MKLPNPPPQYEAHTERTRNLILEKDSLLSVKQNTGPTLTSGTRVAPAAWDDLRFPASVLRTHPQQENPEFDPDVPGRLFRHTATDAVYMAAQLPHSWREGSVLKPHVHWTKTTSASGGVYWQLAYRWSSIGQNLESWVTIGNHVPVVSDGDTADRHAYTALPDIDATGRTISAMLLMRLERVHNNVNDNYQANSRLLEFDIHFQVDAYGSRGEMSK